MASSNNFWRHSRTFQIVQRRCSQMALGGFWNRVKQGVRQLPNNKARWIRQVGGQTNNLIRQTRGLAPALPIEARRAAKTRRLLKPKSCAFGNFARNSNLGFVSEWPLGQFLRTKSRRARVIIVKVNQGGAEFMKEQVIVYKSVRISFRASHLRQISKGCASGQQQHIKRSLKKVGLG
jgi:hypothetical protein